MFGNSQKGTLDPKSILFGYMDPQGYCRSTASHGLGAPFSSPDWSDAELLTAQGFSWFRVWGPHWGVGI